MRRPYSRLAAASALAVAIASVTIADKSKTDGFVLTGLGVSKATGVGFTGMAAWTVTLKAGTYRYGSLKHPATRLSFRVSG
jgi:hypothetical protein